MEIEPSNGHGKGELHRLGGKAAPGLQNERRSKRCLENGSSGGLVSSICVPFSCDLWGQVCKARANLYKDLKFPTARNIVHNSLSSI